MGLIDFEQMGIQTEVVRLPVFGENMLMNIALCVVLLCLIIVVGMFVWFMTFLLIGKLHNADESYAKAVMDKDAKIALVISIGVVVFMLVMMYLMSYERVAQLSASDIQTLIKNGVHVESDARLPDGFYIIK